MAITTTMRTQVTQLYVSLFGRAPDAGGLGYWVQQLDGVKTVQALAQDMYNVEPARAYYNAASTNSEIIAKFYTNVLGRTDAAGQDFWTAKLNTLSANSATATTAKGAIIVEMINAVTSYAGTDASALASQALFANKVDTGLYYGFTLSSNDVAGATQILANVTADPASAAAAKLLYTTAATTTLTLGTGVDNVVGTSGNDTFVARIVDNSNTLQSGDKIAGGAGADRLEADIGNSQKFAITAETTSVETIAIRAQAVAIDSNNNNMADGSVPTTTAPFANAVQIDAQRMNGVTRWESNNSRADVVIEDVRILDTQITKDITIAMVETDPGNVDFGVYFDQYSLRAQSNSSSTLTLQLMDTRSQAAGTGPLKDSPYNGFAFNFTAPGATTATLITVKFDTSATGANTTYADLVKAIDTAIKLVPALSNFTVKAGGSFTVSDTLGTLQAGTEVVLTSTTGGTVSATGTGTGWLASGAVPSSSGLHTNISTAATTTIDKVTSQIILDDVGRGSTGGDLVVGGLSVGDTSTSKGVERFEIEVRDNSKLQTINSTNNTLQEVTIKNGVTTSTSFAYVTTVKDAGNLTVNGIAGGIAPTGENAPLPGSAAQHGNYGFTDVRLIDASAMTGKLEFNSVITTNAISKYINLVDTQANPAADTLNTNGAAANFVYTGGTNNDTMNVDIDAGVIASNSKIIAGREDFTLSVNGGAGDDKITVKVVNTALTGNAQNWYNNQDLNNNISISGGDGNDTIRKLGAGDTVIDGGAGNDVIYADNTGAQVVTALVPNSINSTNGSTTGTLATSTSMAQWVFNTADQTSTGFASRNVNDLRSDTNDSYNIFGGKVVVTFKGLTNAATVTIPNVGYKTTDLQINQAIKDAINNDAVLNKLLVAEDGPASSLIVKSLIDGAMATTDLTVTLSAPAIGSLSAADIAAAGAVYKPGVPGTGVAAYTESDILTFIKTDLDKFNSVTTGGDYVTALGNDGTNAITGAASVATSDNLITPGTGNDVIVLGTTLGASAALSSNDTVKFAPAFGNDVIVNFQATGNGIDHLDFTALGGTTLSAAFGTTDKSIAVVTASTANDTAAKVAAFFTDSATASTHVYLSVNATTNVATVYQVVDAAGVGTGSVVATAAGTINLGTTLFSTLTAANFVNASIAGYAQQEGPTGTTAVVVVPGANTIALAAGTSATVAATTAADVFTFDVAAAKAVTANTQYSLTSFNVTSDRLTIDATTALGNTTLSALNGGVDGITVQSNGITNTTLVNFGADANGDAITITLVGIIDPTLVNITVI